MNGVSTSPFKWLVAEANPIKQGLKHIRSKKKLVEFLVAEANPIKQGLKLRGGKLFSYVYFELQRLIQ